MNHVERKRYEIGAFGARYLRPSSPQADNAVCNDQDETNSVACDDLMWLELVANCPTSLIQYKVSPQLPRTGSLMLTVEKVAPWLRPIATLAVEQQSWWSDVVAYEAELGTAPHRFRLWFRRARAVTDVVEYLRHAYAALTSEAIGSVENSDDATGQRNLSCLGSASTCERAFSVERLSVDEAFINPIGFTKWPPLGQAEVQVSVDQIVIGKERYGLSLCRRGALSEADIAHLRQFVSVGPIPIPARPAAIPTARLVVHLAAAGIPLALQCPHSSAWDSMLHSSLLTVLRSDGADSLNTALDREIFSVQLRRAAIRQYGLRSHSRIGSTSQSSISVLLCTRRPEFLSFALAQVASQRSIDLELILGLHGFTATEAVRRVIADFAPMNITVVEISPSTVLGAALNQMAAFARGDFLAKMDDDDWYGRDHLSDQVMVHRYSASDLVGQALEIVYIQDHSETIHRKFDSEVPAALTESGRVSGGSLFLKRDTFAAVGGFEPVPRHEEGRLAESVQDHGGSVYRHHGLNVVVRRRESAKHTWHRRAEHFYEPLTLDAYSRSLPFAPRAEWWRDGSPDIYDGCMLNRLM